MHRLVENVQYSALHPVWDASLQDADVVRGYIFYRATFPKGILNSFLKLFMVGAAFLTNG